jgi:prepilin-type N-terminal cleavage/methylation domain-containing protein
MRKGFTLIELLVVTSIIVFLTALILPNYRQGDKKLALERSVHKLAQDVRRVQDMALSSKEFQGQVPAGYGIYLNKNQPTQYVLFADLDGDSQYGLNEGLETLELEDRVEIDSLSPGSPLTVVFIPPDPDIVFWPDGSLATVTLRTTGAISSSKSVEINKAGLIAVE